MEITPDTKISKILKENPKALDAIMSLSPRFIKLKNPILRNVIAARTSIRTAASIGNCSVEDFYQKLTALGFTIENSKTTVAQPVQQHPKPMSAFLKNLSQSQCVNLDVRPVIEQGNDPLQIIMQAVKKLSSHQVLKIINSFEPTPLIALLEKKGYQSFVETISEDEIHTYFYSEDAAAIQLPDENEMENAEDFDTLVKQFGDNLVTIDVSELKMPGPMQTILQTLETLDPKKALFVHHKRVPVFLLPELQERGFDYRMKLIEEGKLQLLIFKS